MIYKLTERTPLGKMDLLSDDKAWLKKAGKELKEYFKGKRKRFTLRIDVDRLFATDFQKKVWKGLLKIPYGKLVSYGDLAKMIRRPKAVRAVGSACGKNPIPIIIPCHRVIAGNGKLGGFSCGLWRKKWLLKHEQV